VIHCLDLLTALFYRQRPGCWWHPLPQWHIASSHSTWSPSGPPDPPTQNFPDSWLPAYTSACSYSFPGAGLCIPFWTSWGYHPTISPTCPVSSE